MLSIQAKQVDYPYATMAYLERKREEAVQGRARDVRLKQWSGNVQNDARVIRKARDLVLVPVIRGRRNAFATRSYIELPRYEYRNGLDHVAFLRIPWFGRCRQAIAAG